MAELAEGARLLSECAVKAAPRVRIPLSPPIFYEVETFEKCSILFKFKGNSAGKRNWTAVRLPARAIPQDCGRVNAKI